MSQPPARANLAPTSPLVDPFGRRLHYLRLSITDRCNLRCLYCLPAQGIAKLPQRHILTLEELARVARVAVSLGVDKIRLTGGEPLLRRGIGSLLAALDGLRPRPDLRLTTNGVLLAQHLELLEQHGISAVNVSLDSLDPDRYGRITGLGSRQGAKVFRQVWEGIETALARNRLALKINMVVLKGLNHDQVVDFARLTRNRPLAVRFIEYMPVGRRQPFDRSRFLSSQQVLQNLEETLGPLEPLPARPGDGPAQRWRVPGWHGELGVISAVSSHFCHACNRLRVSAEGRLVPCLLSERAVDLRPLLRGGADEVELAAALRRAAAIKPAHHGLAPDHLEGTGCPMRRLGG